jgi:hypothetical protein
VSKISSIKVAVVILVLMFPLAAWSCGMAGPNTHVGNVLSVDAKGKTFTIKDAQTQRPITFTANSKIIEGLKDMRGMITVNYEEHGDDLNAVGVTF